MLNLEPFKDWQWLSYNELTMVFRIGQTKGITVEDDILKLEFEWAAEKNNGHGQPWTSCSFELAGEQFRAVRFETPITPAAAMTRLEPGLYLFKSGTGFTAAVMGPYHRDRIKKESVAGLT